MFRHPIFDLTQSRFTPWSKDWPRYRRHAKVDDRRHPTQVARQAENCPRRSRSSSVDGFRRRQAQEQGWPDGLPRTFIVRNLRTHRAFLDDNPPRDVGRDPRKVGAKCMQTGRFSGIVHANFGPIARTASDLRTAVKQLFEWLNSNTFHQSGSAFTWNWVAFSIFAIAYYHKPIHISASLRSHSEAEPRGRSA